jgi:RNA polymerase sigma factor (sigma-70 family)
MELKELVFAFKEGNEEVFKDILKECKPIIELVLRKYKFRISGYEKADFFQIAHIAIYKAIYKFDENIGTFESICFTCVKNQLSQEVIKNINNKNSALNDSYSLNVIASTDTEKNEYLDLMSSEQSFSHEPYEFIDPANQLVMKETIGEFTRFLHKCSKRQRMTYILKRQGFTYEEIAQKLGLNRKQVDNALSQIKEKLKNYNTEGNSNRNVG